MADIKALEELGMELVKRLNKLKEGLMKLKREEIENKLKEGLELLIKGILVAFMAIILLPHLLAVLAMFASVAIIAALPVILPVAILYDIFGGLGLAAIAVGSLGYYGLRHFEQNTMAVSVVTNVTQETKQEEQQLGEHSGDKQLESDPKYQQYVRACQVHKIEPKTYEEYMRLLHKNGCSSKLTPGKINAGDTVPPVVSSNSMQLQNKSREVQAMP